EALASSVPLDLLFSFQGSTADHRQSKAFRPRIGQPANCILPRLRSFVNTILYHASPACAPLRAWSTRAPSRHRPAPCSPQRNVAYHATSVGTIPVYANARLPNVWFQIGTRQIPLERSPRQRRV